MLLPPTFSILLLLLLVLLASFSTAEDCVYGWIKYKTKCYRYISDHTLYEECDDLCSAQVVNSTMLCIENQDQVDFLHNYVVWQAHIGLRRYNVSDDFAWFGGCYSSYTRWNAGEPNNLAGDELYVEMMGSSATWYDYSENYNDCACEYALVSPSGDDDGDDDYGGGYHAVTDDDTGSSSTTYWVLVALMVLFGTVCFFGPPVCLIVMIIKRRAGAQDAAVVGSYVNPGSVSPARSAVQLFGAPTAPTAHDPAVHLHMSKMTAGPIMQPTPTVPYHSPPSRTANLAMVYAAPHVEMVPLGAPVAASASAYGGAGAGLRGDYAFAYAHVVGTSSDIENTSGVADK